MRFLASWWQRIPVRAATPTLVAIFVAVGVLGFASQSMQRILGAVWG